MMINRIGDIQNISEPKRSKPALKRDDVSRSDSASISAEGRQAAEFARNLQMVNDAPNVRVDRVREIKDRISDGTYNFDDMEIINKVAGEITSILLRE